MNAHGDPRAADDSAFDLRTRAELALAFEAGEPPTHLLRHAPMWRWRGAQRGAAALALAVAAGGTVLAVRPPDLVRDAIEHEFYERTLRGSYLDAPELLQQLGLAGRDTVPGSPQLTRRCDVGGHVAYHFTTYFDKGGIVTVFAFDKPLPLAEGSGWWGDVHWQVVTSRAGKPLVLVAQQKRALAVARSNLVNSPA